MQVRCHVNAYELSMEAHVILCLNKKGKKDHTERLEAERALVALPDFKSGAPGEELGGWVRFPCASAI